MAEVEKLKSALADMIKKARNQNVSLSSTAWKQRPPDERTHDQQWVKRQCDETINSANVHWKTEGQ
eukprot:6131131-Amphidinium_carterae.1